MKEPIIGAQPESNMKERCITITLDRYNELIEKEELLEKHCTITNEPITNQTAES